MTKQTSIETVIDLRNYLCGNGSSKVYSISPEVLDDLRYSPIFQKTLETLSNEFGIVIVSKDNPLICNDSRIEDIKTVLPSIENLHSTILKQNNISNIYNIHQKLEPKFANDNSVLGEEEEEGEVIINTIQKPSYETLETKLGPNQPNLNFSSDDYGKIFQLPNLAYRSLDPYTMHYQRTPNWYNGLERNVAKLGRTYYR